MMSSIRHPNISKIMEEPGGKDARGGRKNPFNQNQISNWKILKKK